MPDSLEAATHISITWLAISNDTPGASKARRQAFLEAGPRMLDFLIGQGLKFSRISNWPDYYDEAPAARCRAARSLPICSTSTNWATRRAAAPQLPADAGLARRRAATAARQEIVGSQEGAGAHGLRIVIAKLTGKHYVTAGAALQGRMMQAALKPGSICASIRRSRN